MKEVQVIKPIIETQTLKRNNNISRKRVCAYCRVSTDLEDQITSYYSQITYYTDYIKKNKDWKFVGIYADEGISGTQVKKRAEFIRMLNDCNAGLIDMIIAKSISRFARNTVDTLNTVRTLRELGIDVFFEKENIHTIKMNNEMFLTLYSAFAQAESESTAENVRMGNIAKMKRGEPCGKAGCYGLNWNNELKEMTIIKDEAEIIKKIFQLYLKGHGTTLIAQKLMEEGVKAPGGGLTWHPGTIKDILRNVKYVGDICGQRFFSESPLTHKQIRNRGQKPMYYVENHHEGIIDRETFNKAQKIYNSRSIKIKDGKIYCEKFSLRYVFSSMIYCECCGQRYVRRVSPYKNKDGVIHTNAYWACSTKTSYKKACNCKYSETIREEELKSLFLSIFNKFIEKNTNDELILKIKDVILKEDYDKKILLLDNKINQTREKISKLLDLSINNDIEQETFIIKNRELNEELKELNNNKSKLLEKQNSNNYQENRIKEIEKTLKKSTISNRKFDEEVFKKLIKKVIIGEYDENHKFIPNVVKFVLNVNDISLDSDVHNRTNFLSLEIDEGNNKSAKMLQ